MNLFAYAIALLEGFSTLAVEILAIRKATPIVGSSVVLTGIILGVILLALSSGYYYGGYLSSKLEKDRIKRVLQFNLLFAGIFYSLFTFSLSEITITYFINLTGNYLLALFIFATLLLFLPVFIASQTLPLLTEYLEDEKKGLAAGKILFFSTIGSFFGSIIPPIFLFEKIGVEKTVFVVSLLLILCSILIEIERRRRINFFSIIALSIVSLALITPMINNCIYSFASAYQDICVYDQEANGKQYRIFSQNNGYSSGIDLSNEKSFFTYVREAINLSEIIKPAQVLMLGGAGFTYPHEISTKDYTEKVDVVDVDKSVKGIAEKYFFERPLSPKITFHPISGRYFINQSVRQKKSYDFVFVDVYYGKFTIPNEFLTKEFFDDLNSITQEKKIIFNMILASDLSGEFVQNLFTTLDKSYGDIYYKKTNSGTGLTLSNFIVTPYPFSDYTKWEGVPGSVYTDDKGTYETDKEKMFFRNE